MVFEICRIRLRYSTEVYGMKEIHYSLSMRRQGYIFLKMPSTLPKISGYDPAKGSLWYNFFLTGLAEI